MGTPEIRQKLRVRAEKRKVRHRKQKRVQRYQKAANLNKRTWAQSNVKMMRSAPSNYRSVNESSRMMTNQLQAVYSVSNRADYTDDSAYEQEETVMENMLANIEI